MKEIGKKEILEVIEMAKIRIPGLHLREDESLEENRGLRRIAQREAKVLDILRDFISLSYISPAKMTATMIMMKDETDKKSAQFIELIEAANEMAESLYNLNVGDRLRKALRPFKEIICR